MLEQQPH